MNLFSPPNNRVELTKWYMDCVRDDGYFCIAYQATLKWKKLRLHLANILFGYAPKSLHTKTSTAHNPEPSYKSGQVEWLNDSLGVRGEWEALEPAVDKKLYENDQAYIRWQCLLPRGRAVITLPDGEVIRGLGYVEKLQMKLFPLDLPLDMLRWGRFLTADDSMVWIRWTGPTKRNLLIHNGQEYGESHINNDAIIVNDATVSLVITERRELRSGDVQSTVFSPIRDITNRLPQKMLNIDEHKWLSRGTLLHKGSEINSGWVIHEEVLWRR